MERLQEAMILQQMEHIIQHLEKMPQQQEQYMEYMIWQVEVMNLLWEYLQIQMENQDQDILLVLIQDLQEC